MSIDISAVKTIGSGILRPEGVKVGLGAAEWVRTFEWDLLPAPNHRKQQDGWSPKPRRRKHG